MEDPGSIPAEISRTPQTLIGFTGLELHHADHRRIWELFSSNRGLDRHALHFLLLPWAEEMEFPVAKPKRSSYEWYTFKGILKKDWIHKHQDLLPAVLVLFAELNWNEPMLQDKTRACAQRIQKVRTWLQGRHTKICVVLLQSEAGHAGGADTVTAFCTECEISSRCVFVLGLSDQLLGSVVRLEAALNELSQNYYHLHIKNVRAHKDLLNKSYHHLLMVRHQFKIGYFNEMKNDIHAAHKAYLTAYNLLIEFKANEHTIAEIRTVAGYINYKLCRLGFRLNQGREAVNQFRRHMESLGRAGPAELAWEQAAWQAGQAAAFAQLFQEAGQSVPAQHPGIYFKLAANYAISRRKLAEEQCSQEGPYPEPDPLAGQVDYYGQRPWRPGRLEPVDLQRERESIVALQHKERTNVQHSQRVIDLQLAALRQFQLAGSPRMKTEVEVQMAEELMVDQRYEAALSTLLPCARAYRAELWAGLATAVLLKALKCAFLTVKVAAYLELCLELAGPTSTCPEAEKARIRQNFFLVLELKVPLPEPSLTNKSERAAVGEASRAWRDALDILVAAPVTLDISEFQSLLEVRILMPPAARVGEPLKLGVSLRNHASDRDFVVSELSCRLSLANHEAGCRSDDPVTLPAGGADIQLEFSLRPANSEVGTCLEVLAISLRLEEPARVRLVKTFPGTAAVPDVKKGSEPLGWCGSNNSNSSVRIGTREANVEMRSLGQEPLLVGEWFPLRLELVSKEAGPVTDIEVACWLRDGADPLIGDTTTLSLEPNYPPPTPTTPGSASPSDRMALLRCTQKHPSLTPCGSECLVFYLRASTPGVRVVALQLRYSVEFEGSRFSCSSLKLQNLDVILPFTFSSKLLTIMMQETRRANTDEEFLVVPEVISSSPHTLTVLGARMECRAPVGCRPPAISVENSQLDLGSRLEECYPALVKAQNLLTSFDVESVSLGRYVLEWRRTASHDLAIRNQTVFELPNVKVHLCCISVECRLPAFGVLHTPLHASYLLLNRTEALQEFSLTMEPTDSFMFSGPKQLRFKLFPRDRYQLSYLLYPLIAGTVPLPRLKLVPLANGGVPALEQCSMVEEVLARTLPTALTVLPLARTDTAAAVLLTEQLQLTEPVILPNLPFVSNPKKSVKG